MAKKIKILSVVPGDESPNSMVYAKEQVAAINDSEIETKLFLLRSRLSPVQLFKSWKLLRKEIKAFKPDIIHAYYGTITSFFCAVSTFKPLVISFQGSDLNKTPSDGLIRDLSGRLLSQLSILRASATICVSEKLKSRIWWQKSKAHVIPNGINTDVFLPMPKNEARRHLNWKDEEEKVILFNANNPKIKRLDIAESTIREVQKHVPARLLALQGSTAPAEITYLLNACDCLLLCSDSEGSPMIIKEALACNTPIATVDVGDVKERISGVNGTLITEKMPASLADAILTLLAKNEKTNGRQKLLNDGLSATDIVNKVRNIYKTILHRN